MSPLVSWPFPLEVQVGNPLRDAGLGLKDTVSFLEALVRGFSRACPPAAGGAELEIVDAWRRYRGICFYTPDFVTGRLALDVLSLPDKHQQFRSFLLSSSELASSIVCSCREMEIVRLFRAADSNRRGRRCYSAPTAPSRPVLAFLPTVPFSILADIFSASGCAFGTPTETGTRDTCRLAQDMDNKFRSRVILPLVFVALIARCRSCTEWQPARKNWPLRVW